VGVETTALEVRLAEAEEDEARVDAHAGGVKTDEVATLPVGLRYQFSAGSPKHSPIVTPTYPLFFMYSSIYTVKFCAVCMCISCAIARNSFVFEFAPSRAAAKLALGMAALSGVMLL
jgi:hypothetical protein